MARKIYKQVNVDNGMYIQRFSAGTYAISRYAGPVVAERYSDGSGSIGSASQNISVGYKVSSPLERRGEYGGLEKGSVL